MALERAHEALFYVGLAEARYRKLGTYSLGMKQLAKLAQAIVHGPKLLILDEPTNGLDPSARQRMIRMIKDIRDGKEMRIVLCSHLLRDVEDTCDEVLILKQGRIAHYSNLDEERRANNRFLELEIYGANGDFTDGIEKLGWLAVALVIFARWKPVHAVWGSYLFGMLFWLFFYILGLTRSSQELFKMLPYIVTIAVLVVVSLKKNRENEPPASLGLAYFREER
jgi:energy-coupling factor transporter ATP-binding protein EcfA2